MTSLSAGGGLRLPLFVAGGSIAFLSAAGDMKRLLLSSLLLVLVHLALAGEPSHLLEVLAIHVAVEVAVELLLHERRDRSPR
jgi:hypothetical protein